MCQMYPQINRGDVLEGKTDAQSAGRAKGRHAKYVGADVVEREDVTASCGVLPNLEGEKVGTGAGQRFYFKDGFIDAKISQIGPFCNR